MTHDNQVDGMTPKERMGALLEGKPYDRIPCLASIGDHAALVIGIKVSEFSLSSQDMARGIIAAYRTYGDDGVGIGQGRTVMAEALGRRVSYPAYGSPYVDEYVIKKAIGSETIMRYFIQPPNTAYLWGHEEDLDGNGGPRSGFTRPGQCDRAGGRETGSGGAASPFQAKFVLRTPCTWEPRRRSRKIYGDLCFELWVIPIINNFSINIIYLK